MDRVQRRLRHVCIAIIAIASAAAGLAGLWHVGTPEHLPFTGTWMLLVMLALVILPLITIAAWDLDRRTALEQPEEPSEPAADTVDLPAIEPVADNDAETRSARPPRTIQHSGAARASRGRTDWAAPTADSQASQRTGSPGRT